MFLQVVIVLVTLCCRHYTFWRSFVSEEGRKDAGSRLAMFCCIICSIVAILSYCCYCGNVMSGSKLREGKELPCSGTFYSVLVQSLTGLKFEMYSVTCQMVLFLSLVTICLYLLSECRYLRPMWLCFEPVTVQGLSAVGRTEPRTAKVAAYQFCE